MNESFSPVNVSSPAATISELVVVCSAGFI
jgi:hypothetical protein